MENLTWLMRWFESRCDGSWESDFGVTIETVNNPGWMVRIDLDGTGLDPSSFRPLAEQRSGHDWVECKVVDGMFYAGAGVNNLDEVLGVFRAWVEGAGSGRQGRRVGRDGGAGDGVVRDGGGRGRRRRGDRLDSRRPSDASRKGP